VPFSLQCYQHSLSGLKVLLGTKYLNFIRVIFFIKLDSMKADALLMIIDESQYPEVYIMTCCKHIYE